MTWRVTSALTLLLTCDVEVRPPYLSALVSLRFKCDRPAWRCRDVINGVLTAAVLDRSAVCIPYICEKITPAAGSNGGAEEKREVERGCEFHREARGNVIDDWRDVDMRDSSKVTWFPPLHTRYLGTYLGCRPSPRQHPTHPYISREIRSCRP